MGIDHGYGIAAAAAILYGSADGLRPFERIKRALSAHLVIGKDLYGALQADKQLSRHEVAP
jgi:hypothetical protein